MLPAEEFLYGCSAVGAVPAGTPPWVRPLAQWFGVGLAHIVVISFVLQMSPQARPVLGDIIQVSLVAAQVQAVAKPPEPIRQPPRQTKMLQPQRQAPVLAIHQRAEAPPASFQVEKQPAEPVPAAEAVPASLPVSPPALVPPVFNAAYLENPPPQYPAMSRRLGEKGRVLLRVFVSAAGRAEQVEIKTSSNFERLDFAAREAVYGWRFVPARRGDDQVAAWVLVPVSFVM